MNIYDQNLRDAVCAMLDSQQLEQKMLAAQLNAAQFTSYYAEGAVHTAGIKLDQSKTELAPKAQAKQQAVNNRYISTNLLASATQTDQYTKQAVSNAAVCASNVQIAANAILRLASDMGSIFSIVKAGDMSSDIYNYATEIHELINTTAYNAEVASQCGMEASMLTSEISSSGVLAGAKSTNLLVDNLLSIISSDVNTLEMAVAANSAGLSASLDTVQIAKGSLLDIFTDEAAASSALKLTNNEINLDLNVLVADNACFKVSFEALKNPFDKPGAAIIDAYYLILVKDRNRQVFNLSNAEYLLQNMAQSFAQVTQVPIAKHHVLTMPFDAYHMKQKDGTEYVLKDSDGDNIKNGQNYVMVLLAVYNNTYKKKLNNFDNFLSGPSNVFALTTQLEAVDSKTIHVETVKDAGHVQQLSFSVNTKANNNIAYRCIFLPAGFTSLNLVLAANVAAGNYTIAVADKKNAGRYLANIGFDTTDNFGNPLIKGRQYTPVILTIALDEPDSYTNGLSVIDNTRSFYYDEAK